MTKIAKDERGYQRCKSNDIQFIEGGAGLSVVQHIQIWWFWEGQQSPVKHSCCWQTTQPASLHPQCEGRGGCSLPQREAELHDQGGTGELHVVRQVRLETHSCHRVPMAGTTGTTHLTTQSRAWLPPAVTRALTSTLLPRTKNWMLNGPEMAKAFAIFFVAAFTYNNKQTKMSIYKK